jgi:NADH-quinone oxidoreductase subunit E
VSCVRTWLDEATRRFPGSREAVIPLLQSTQAEFGYVPREAMEGIARALRMPPAQVQGIATFYAQFRFHPPGRHRVTVCRGTACHVRGSGRLLEELERTLGIGAGTTTPDGEFMLETVACVGSCALAPVLLVDGRAYARQTASAARKTIERVRNAGATADAEKGGRS